jgi:hypothetical protein
MLTWFMLDLPSEGQAASRAKDGLDKDKLMNLVIQALPLPFRLIKEYDRKAGR